MYQVLTYLPLKTWFGIGWDIPIHGYGFMLFLAFIGCTFLATMMARRQGIKPEIIQDMAIFIFLGGIVGARLVFVVQEWWEFYQNPWKFLAIWDGGLVFYGSAIGGVVGYIMAYYRLLRPNKISFWKMADIIAPCVALGLCLGRIGCLLNGCCFGHVACPECPAVSFPMPTAPRQVAVLQGYQTAAGFTMDNQARDGRTVGVVVPESPAFSAGLRPSDVILAVNGNPFGTYGELEEYFTQQWPRGKNTVQLSVKRGNQEVNLPPFKPLTVGLHPTQIYESITTALMLFFLLSYYPFRRHDGELFILLMLFYAFHRFINEMLRNDTPIYGDFLTLSQNISVVVFLVGLVLGVVILRRPRDYYPGQPQEGFPSVQEEKPIKDLPDIALQD